MIPREFGQTGVKLSPVTFGSMRLDPEQIKLEKAVELITYLFEQGVNTFHSSHEYDTDSFFCQVLQEFRQLHPGASIAHIAKIGVPHFGEAEFSSDKLIALIEQRLRELDTERIDLVQWLVRQQPNDDRHRLPILAQCQSELQETWSKLQQQGKVGALASFPYSVPFAETVLKTKPCQGLVTYLNLLELEMIPFLNQMEAAGQGYVAIRPLGGGMITSQAGKDNEKLQTIISKLNLPIADLTKFAIQFPLLHPAVTSVMVSVSSIDHAAQVIEAVNNLESDHQYFYKILNSISPKIFPHFNKS